MILDKNLAFKNSAESSEIMDFASSGNSNYKNFKADGYFDAGHPWYLNILMTESYASTGSCNIDLESAESSDPTFSGTLVTQRLASLTTHGNTPAPAGMKLVRIALPAGLKDLVRVRWTSTNVTAGEAKVFITDF